jgi:homoserine O-acetyltransferase/O-succinyltransferase
MLHTYRYHQPFQLESGIVLPGFHLAYTTLGQLNEAGNNVVWIFHALTANSNPAEWWPGLVGEGKLFNPDQHFIVCVNMPGSCYGSISPLDAAEYYDKFPLFTIKDMVAAYQHLKDDLGIQKIHIGIGGSMGGQQLLEWSVTAPLLFDHIIPIATNAFHSPWAIAFNASQRICIENDPTWKAKTPDAGMAGMKAARGVALLSYRNYKAYGLTQSEATADLPDSFKSDAYQRYQGEKLAKRFNAYSYYFLSKSMDSHHLGRGRSSLTDALQSIRARTLVIGISSDILFPPEEQQFLAAQIPDAALAIIDSNYGHDGFLLEFEQLENIVLDFLQQRAYAFTRDTETGAPAGR